MATTTPQKELHIKLSNGKIVSLLLMLGTSLIISFYLGFVTSESLRTPVQTITPQKIVEETGPLSQSIEPEELDFFKSLDGESTSSKSDQPSVINVKQLDQIKDKTSQLQEEQAKLERQKKAAQALATPPPTTVPKTKSESPPAENVSNVTKEPPPLVQSQQVGLYTVQVFTSGNKKRAEELVKRIIESGYLDAYLQKYETSNQRILYRVRIGKTNKDSAESLARKVLKLDFIEHAQLTRL